LNLRTVAVSGMRFFRGSCRVVGKRIRRSGLNDDNKSDVLWRYAPTRSVYE